jgi:hypothetical protein
MKQNEELIVVEQLGLAESTIGCPYCGELITILVDRSIETQQYIEDCQVCCRPIDILVTVSDDGSFQVDARDENS